MMIFWRDIIIGFLAWCGTIYAEKRMTTALFIEPRNTSDWLMLLMFNPVSLLITISLIGITLYTFYRMIRRHIVKVTYRRIFPGLERLLHIVLILYGSFLTVITVIKFPLFGSGILCLLVLYEIIQFLPARSKNIDDGLY
ncbi:hypothetical protein [Brevibacillus sp. SYSU BS000544]|uniref:hypothetical protein n=1 Tax=Brevibacillus sp. SYSU BS000544 TaxID=3416443 RepID=UPI003CE58ED0